VKKFARAIVVARDEKIKPWSAAACRRFQGGAEAPLSKALKLRG
jgi:hypothetical protein